MTSYKSLYYITYRYSYFLPVVVLLLFAFASNSYNSKPSKAMSSITIEANEKCIPSLKEWQPQATSLITKAVNVRACSACMQNVCVNFSYSMNPENRHALSPSFFLAEPSFEVAVLNWIWVFLHRHKDNGLAPVFVDIGMNAGFFTAFASSLGAEVFAFEPQESCMFLGYSSVLAQSSRLPHFYNMGITGTPSSFTTSGGKCDPGNVAKDDTGKSRVMTVNLASVWNQLCAPEIDMIKIDTEGSEVSVLQGLIPFFEARKVRGAVIEITEPATRQSGGWTVFGASPEIGIALFSKIEGFGYEILYLWSDAYSPLQYRRSSSSMGFSNVLCHGASNELELVKSKDLLNHIRISKGGNYLLRKV